MAHIHPKYETLVIRVMLASENQGYFYDIYENEEAMEQDKSLDGGLCTTTLQSAIGMASAQAIVLADRAEK